VAMNVDIPEDGLFLYLRALSPRFSCGHRPLQPRLPDRFAAQARAATDVWGKPVGIHLKAAATGGVRL